MDQKILLQDIEEVVTNFYAKATKDVLIGYHFKKIPDFASHLPRIMAFWELQLLGKSDRPLQYPFDVMKVHLELKIRPGQLNRWLVLFRETLNEKNLTIPHTTLNQERINMLELWQKKLAHFEGKFWRFPGMFDGL